MRPTRRAVLRSAWSAASALTLAAAASATTTLQVGSAAIQVSFAGASCDLPQRDVVAWVHTAARAVTSYFGRFPVDRARVEITIVEDRSGVLHGTSWGYDGALTKIAIGQHTTMSQLHQDWVMTHEFVHYGFPSVGRHHHWMEEGSATYIEPIARAQIAELTAEEVWSEMFRDMGQGLPRPADDGLDNTESWASTYWGGGLFCLLADVRIRQKTERRKGLQDAFSAVNRAGGTIEVDWPLQRAFDIGDRATGTEVLTQLYSDMGVKHASIDLPLLWRQLGVGRREGKIVFDDGAPLANVRRAILDRTHDRT